MSRDTILGLDSPVAAFGVVDVSRPVAAKLLGYSIITLNRMVAEGGLFRATGKCHKRISLPQIEALRGRPVSVHDYLSATAPSREIRAASPSTRREPRRTNPIRPTPPRIVSDGISAQP